MNTSVNGLCRRSYFRAFRARRALLCVLKNALDPAEFSAFLLNEQLQHPDGFMIRMTNFLRAFSNRVDSTTACFLSI